MPLVAKKYMNAQRTQELIDQIKQYVADHGGSGVVATVAVSTTSSELYNKPIAVTNNIGETVYETTFNSTGNALVKLTDFGTYTFTVTY